MPDDLRCPSCGNYRDTPMHELGCPDGEPPAAPPASSGLAGLLADPGDPFARMDAYYYSFKPTGVALVDRILSAVATAGKRAHHTETWQDDWWADEGGVSPRDRIQQAAERSAAELRAAASGGGEAEALVWPLKGLALDLACHCENAKVDLRARREELGLPLDVVADRMAYDVDDVEQHMERYDGDPSLSMLRRYALAVHARLGIRVVPVEVEPVDDGKGNA